MAVEGVQWAPHTMVAGEDLSGKDTDGKSLEDRFVKLTSTGTVELYDTVADKPFGVLKNRPKNGFPAHIALGGVIRVRAGGTIAVGNPIGSDAEGKAINQTSTGRYAIGIALEAGVDDQIIQVLVRDLIKI